MCWVRGDYSDTSDIEKDLEAFGVDPADFIQKETDSTFDVFEENWQALNVFLACATQWRTAGEWYIGLDYPSVESVMRIYSIKDKRDTFERVQVLESSALAEWRKNK